MAELNVEQEVKNFISKEQIIEFVGDVLNIKLVDPVLSKNGLRWSKTKPQIEPEVE